MGLRDFVRNPIKAIESIGKGVVNVVEDVVDFTEDVFDYVTENPWSVGLTILGFGIAGPVGAIIGFGLGHGIDHWNEWSEIPEQEPPEVSRPSYTFSGPKTIEGLSYPVPIVYGNVKTSGALIYRGGMDEVNDFFLAISEGPVQSITDVRVNDVLVTDLEGASVSVYTGTGTQDPDDRFVTTWHSELNSPLQVWDLATDGENPNPLPYAQTSFQTLEPDAVVLLKFRASLPWPRTEADRVLKFKVEYKLQSDTTWKSQTYAVLFTGNTHGVYDFWIPLSTSTTTDTFPVPYHHYDELRTNWSPPSFTGDTAQVAVRAWFGGDRSDGTIELPAERLATAGTYDLKVTFQWVKYETGDERTSGTLVLADIRVAETNGKQAFRHTAYVAATIPASEIVRGAPRFTARVQGINTVKYWDAATSSWVTGYSNNPIWCLRDLLTNPRYGLGIPESLIDDETFKTAAAYCDELVGSEPRFSFNYIFDRREPADRAIRAVLSHCRGLWWIDEGKFKVRIEKPTSVAAQIDVGDVVDGSMECWHEAEEQLPDALIARYIDASQNFEKRSFIVGNVVRGGRIEEREWLGCTSLAQAKRLAYYAYNIARRTARIRFRTPLSTLALEPGDVVEVFHPVGPFGYDISNPDNPVKQASGAKFIIISVTDGPNDIRTYVCRQYDEAVYNDTPSISDPLSVTDTSGSVYDRLGPVEDLNVTTELRQSPDGIWRTVVHAEWRHPKPLFVSRYLVYQNRHSTQHMSGRWQLVGDVSEPVHSWELPVDWTGMLAVMVIPVSKIGIRGDRSSITTTTVVADMTPPAAPTGLSASFDKSVVWTWDAPSDSDFDHFEVSLDGGVSWSRVDANRYEIANPTTRTYTLWVRAVDRTGNTSNHTESTATLSTPAAPNLTYLHTQVRDNICQVWVDSAFTESPGHIGYVFEWRKVGDAAWTAIEGNVATIVVPLSDFGSNNTLDIEIRYAEKDVIGQGTMSTATTVTLSKPDYGDMINVPPQEQSLWVPPDGELFEFRENVTGSKGTAPL